MSSMQYGVRSVLSDEPSYSMEHMQALTVIECG